MRPTPIRGECNDEFDDGSDAKPSAVCRPGCWANPAHRRCARAKHRHGDRYLQGRHRLYRDEAGRRLSRPGGVQSWSEATSPAIAPSQPGTQPAPTTTQRATPAPTGAGQVWVNTASKVYHCPGTRWYGKTQQGSYMPEAEARAQGARPDHGKACTS